MKRRRNNQALINECERATARVLTGEMQLFQIFIPAAATITPPPPHPQPSSLADHDASVKASHSGRRPSSPDSGAGMDGIDGKEKNGRGNSFSLPCQKAKKIKNAFAALPPFCRFFFGL